jgi:hypothetical protein
MTIGATEYTLTTNNLPMTFNLKQGNERIASSLSPTGGREMLGFTCDRDVQPCCIA